MKTNQLLKRSVKARKPRRNPLSENSKLRLLGLPDSLIKVIQFFALHPDEKIRFRELQRRLELGSASLQRDLDRLIILGVVRRIVDQDSLTHYSAAPHSGLWVALLGLVRELSEPEVLVREAVRDVPGIDAAFIYGSVAHKTARPDSDIDLFVVADNLDRHVFYRNVAELGQVTGKEVNAIQYSKAEFAKRLAGNTRFVREVLEGEKVWVVGDGTELAPIAIAAGLTESSVRSGRSGTNV